MNLRKYIAWLVPLLVVFAGASLIGLMPGERIATAIAGNAVSFIIGSAGFVVLAVICRRAAMQNMYGNYIAIGWLLFLLFGYFLNTIVLKGDASVTFNVVATVEKNDEFQVFYIGKDDVASEAQSVRRAIKGSPQSQVISLSLPDSILIKKIRFDLGFDSTQKSMQVSEIYISAHDKKLFLFKPAKTVNYFSTNEYVRTEQNVLQLHPSGGHYDPFMYTGDFGAEYLDVLKAEKHLPFPFLIAFIFIIAPAVYLLFFAGSPDFRTQFYGIAAYVFVALLFIPSINETFHIIKDENAEKRNLSPKPVLDENNLLEYPKLFDAYYNDHFGFRVILAQLGGKIRYHVFGTSSVPSKAAVGKDDWMFLSGKHYNIDEDLLKTNLYSDEELAQAAAEWQNRKAELWKDSIRYYKAFFPDKHYIYPEFLPFQMRVINKDTLARCDQAILYLEKTGASIKLIDVRPQLLREKQKNRLFFKYDSHWNSYGGYLAYSELMRNFSVDFPNLKPHAITEYHVGSREKTGGDLAEMLGVKLTEPEPVFELAGDPSHTQAMSTEGFPVKTVIYENPSASSDLTILIFRDSFTNAVVEFMKPHFKKIVLIWDTPYSKPLVNQVKPDIVLECYVTRYFR